MSEAQALRDEAVALLRDLLRIDTSNPPGRETAAAQLLARYLEDNGVVCELVARDPERANLVARLPGRGRGPSLMLLGHTDVVPADPDGWRYPPFDGFLDDQGYVWGRGALDMKNEVASRAVAMAALARSGERLEGDLVFAAVSDEEDGTNGVGMSWLVEARPDLATDYVLNEGAVERLVLADGRTVVTLSVGDAEPADIDRAIEQAAALHPALRGMISPLLSTTIAPTRLHGSDALNVLPARASVDCDCRLLPGTTLEDLRAELIEALGTDLRYELEFLDPLVGGSISPLDSRLYTVCERFLARHDPDAVLLPLVCPGFTDSHYARVSYGSVAYGLWPIRRTPFEIWSTTVHGHDERIHVDDLGYATLFHLEACRTLLGADAG